MKKKIIIAVFLALLTLLSLFVVYYYKIKTRNTIDILAEKNMMINILVAGSNVYNNNKHNFYSIISYNPDNNKIGITFIPPELEIDMAGKGKSVKRIDEVDINDFEKLAVSLYRDLKLKIPFYVILYSPDVERIVDLMEGVDLYVLDPVKSIDGIKFGINYFDGDKIVKYINSVEENSIYKKYDRIQDILLTLFYNRKDYQKYFTVEIVSEVLKSIKTNFLAQEIVSLAKLIYDRDSEINCTLLPGFLKDNGFYIIDEIAYKIYKNDFIKGLILEKNTEQPVKIKILNSTNVSGLAKKVRRKLVNEGINVVEFGTSPYLEMEQSVLINQKGEIDSVKKISKILGINKIYHIIDSAQLHNVLLIIGKDLSEK